MFIFFFLAEKKIIIKNKKKKKVESQIRRLQKIKPLSEHCPAQLTSDTFSELNASHVRPAPCKCCVCSARAASLPCPVRAAGLFPHFQIFWFRFEKFSPDWKERRQKNNPNKKKKRQKREEKKKKEKTTIGQPAC